METNQNNKKEFIPPICLETESYCHIFENIDEEVSIYKMIRNEMGKVVDLQILYFNSNSMLNELTSLEESVDRSLNDIYKEGIVDYIQIANDVVRDKEGKSFEMFFESLEKYFLVTAFSPNDELFITLAKDITEHEKYEVALKESENKYRTIFENTGIAFIIIEDDMTISLMNGEAEKIIGYSREEVENKKKWTEFVAREDELNKMREYHKKRRNDGTVPNSYEFKAITKNKDIIDLFMTVSMIPDTKKSIASFLDVTEHKKKDVILKEREEEFRTLVEHSPDAITRFDKYMRHIFINTAGTLMTGLKEEDYIGKTHEELGMPEELSKNVRNLLNDVFKTGKSNTFEFQILTPEGTKYYFSHNIPEFDEIGNVKSILAIAHDITRRKQIEEKLKSVCDNLEIRVHEKTAELRKSNEELKEMVDKYKSVSKSLESSKDQYQTLVQNMPDIIVRINKKLKGVFINKAALSLFEELTGIPKLDFIGNDFKGLGLHGKTVDSIKSKIIEVFKTRKRIDFELKLNTPAGIKFYQTYFIPEKNDYGDLESVLTITRDITDFKNAEEQSRRFFDMVENSEDAIISLTFDGIIKSWNNGAERIYGYSSPETIEKHATVLMDVSEWEKLEKNIQKIQKGKRLVHYEAERLRKDGKEINVSVSLSPIKDSEGRITGISIISRDITDQIIADMALKESEQKFRELFNKANDMITLVELRENGLPGKFIEVNEVASHRLGYSRKEFLNMTPDQIIAPERLKDVKKVAAELQKEKAVTFEIVHITRDGERIPVEVNNHIFKMGEKDVILAISRDIRQRKIMEDALRESEAKFREIFNNANDMISLNEMKENGMPGKFIEVNEVGIQRLGYSKEELLNMTPMDIVDPKKRDEMPQNAAQLEKKGYATYEIVHITKDGKKIPVEINNHIIEFRGQNVALAASRDISERKKVELALRESEEKYKQFFEASPNFTVQVGLDGTIIAANRAAQEILGKSKEEIIGTNFAELDMLFEEDVPIHVENFFRLLQGEYVKPYETRIKTKDEVHWGDTYPILLTKDNKPNAILVISHDITDRKRAENRLKESEEAFKTLAENSPDVINRINRKLRHVYVNKNGAKLMGLNINDFIGKTFEEMGMKYEQSKFWEKNIQKVFQTGKEGQMDYELQTIQGTKYFTSKLVPEYNNKGEIETVLVLSHDITGRKELEDDLKEKIRELEISNDELQQFAYITSHDLQEPLRTIASYAGLIKRRYEGQLDKDADDFIQFMIEGSIRMKEMIQALLEYSSVGTKGEDFKYFDAENSLKNALSNLRASINENNAQINYVKLPHITADPDQITRVFQNLIGNSIKFHKENETPKIFISAQKGENEWIFSVKDNSIGMEQEYTDRIFEIFRRLHPVGEYKGAGIGLAIVKRIIDRHSGQVWVESELDKGSTFYFTVPFIKTE